MSYKVVLVHGNGNSSGIDHWQPNVQKQLQDAGIECLSPDMPNPVLAKASDWLPFLEELGCDENTVIVGSSSGAVAAMRYAETHRIKGSVLVGTYYTDLGYEDEKASGYFDAPWNWKAMRANQEWIAIFNSTDDPWIPIAEPRHVAESLRSHGAVEYFEFTDRGHFGGDVGATEFPELVDLLTSKLL